MMRPLILTALLLAVTFAAHAEDGTDAARIRRELTKTFDRPEHPLTTPVVVVEGDRAVADWRQGDKGGRALMKRQADGRWEIAYCGGAGLREAATLQASGMSPAAARRLADGLAQAEASLPADDIRRMDAFRGEVRHHPDPETANGGHGYP